MVKPVDLDAVHRMEEEARECERTGDHLGALDIYEELSRSAWATAKHLTQLGFCYRKARQMQDAKKAWLLAIALDQNYQPCRDALNQYFVGWEKQVSHPAAPAHEEPPPPAVHFGSAKGAELSVEMVAPAHPAPAAAAPQPQAAPAPKPEARPKAQPAAPARPAAAPKQEKAAAASPAQEFSESRVNWDFVLMDAAEESTARR
jgi:hypothetical protein